MGISRGFFHHGILFQTDIKLSNIAVQREVYCDFPLLAVVKVDDAFIAGGYVGGGNEGGIVFRFLAYVHIKTGDTCQGKVRRFLDA